ncbi:MAG: TraR/DksA C4-type zinc finger protein [Firmicutes bacterium]|nr:TraR/DksA C4-type zinc finger protein [Bacillota bacterium]
MNPEQLAYFKNRLVEEKNRLESIMANSDSFNLQESLSESTQELAIYDNHPADLGNETFEREKDLALKNNFDEIRQRVNEALERFDAGKYGICEDCGREIGPGRLEALPYTTLCINCQREEEGRRQNRERPIEEEALGAPFGRTFLDDKDYTGFDGEDSWQAVARYGTSESPSDLGGIRDYGDLYLDAGERRGVVEDVEAVIAGAPDEIPPDPEDALEKR